MAMQPDLGTNHASAIKGEQTAGRFAMLDMLIPPGGGPPPHRVPTRTSTTPELSEPERQERLQRAREKAPEYGIEMLPPAS